VPPTPLAAGTGALGGAALHDEPRTDDGDACGEAGRVLGWLQRCTGDPELAEELTVEVFRRRAQTGPAWLNRAPAEVRLRHQVVTAVLRARGTL